MELKDMKYNKIYYGLHVHENGTTKPMFFRTIKERDSMYEKLLEVLCHSEVYRMRVMVVESHEDAKVAKHQEYVKEVTKGKI